MTGQKKIFLCFIALCFSLHLFAIDKNPENIKYLKATKQVYSGIKQQELKQQKSWRNFSEKNKGWFVLFNEITGMPHRAFGKGISLPNFQNVSSAANLFLKNNLSVFNIPLSDIKLYNLNSSGKYHCIDYHQYYKGLKVL